MIKSLAHLLFFITINTPLFSQTGFIQKEKILVNDLEELKLVVYDKRDSVATEFEQHLKSFLSDENSWDYNFQALSKWMGIRTSPDKKLRTFSWNTRMGGTWHSYKAIIQYKFNNILTVVDFQNRNLLQNDDSENDEIFRDVLIGKIHQLNGGYLLNGWGTHGGGHQHTFMAFYKKDKNGKLIRKPLFENQKTSLVLQFPRANKIDLEIKKNKISFNEFIRDDEIGFYLPTGRKITLKKKKGIFKKVN